MVFPADDALAHELAQAAGERLLKLRLSGQSADELRKAGDLGSQDFLAAELARARPDDAVLSEEAVDDPARLTADRVWIIDPLDGTREFGEDGRVDWAVHVALWERGDLTAGAVALPAQDKVLSTAEPPPPPPQRLREPRCGSSSAGQGRRSLCSAWPESLELNWCRWARLGRSRRPSSPEK